MQFGMPTLIENQTLQENVALCSSLGLESSCKNREKERKIHYELLSFTRDHTWQSLC